MRVLILEPHASGHHASYLRWLVQAANQRRWKVAIASTRAALSHPTLRTLAGELDDVHFHLMTDVSVDDGRPVRSYRLMRREFAYWRSFNRAAAEVRKQEPIDAVILPYVDYCFYALALLGSPFYKLPWCAISMRLAAPPDTAVEDSSLTWKWRFARRLLGEPHLQALFSINPSVREVPPSWGSAAQLSKLRYLPDPAEYEIAGVRKELREALGVAEGQIAILVFGSIDERKGIDSLLDSLVAQEGLENYVVILAGRQSGNFRNGLRVDRWTQMVSSKRLIVMDRFLTNEEQNRLFTAVDIVWLGYRNHPYMSGVLVLAGKAGIPVLGTTEGEIGGLIAKYGLGVSARIDRPAEVASALHAMHDVRSRAEMGQRARSAFAGHTAESFGSGVMAAFHSLESP